MVHINFASREIVTKIVYCGPSLSGKTDILRYIEKNLPPTGKGKLLSISNNEKETIFFDHLAIDLGEIAGMGLKFNLYAVPGREHFALARKNVFKGADGIIFVADSKRECLEDNKKALEDALGNLAEDNLTPHNLPFVFQYNKQDLDEAMSTEELDRELNTYGVPSFPSSVEKSSGIFQPLKKIASLILDDLSKSEDLPAEAPEEVVSSSAEDSENGQQRRAINKNKMHHLLSNLLEELDQFKSRDLKERMAQAGEDVSRRSVTRQLNRLIEEGLIQKEGYGKGTVYYAGEKYDKEKGEDL